MSTTLHLDIPDEVFAALQREPGELGAELRLAAAAKWYELGRISQARAAELAGMSRAAFLEALSKFSVSPFQEGPDEILKSVDS